MKVVYYVELFQNVTDPQTTAEPYKRLGPFDKPVAYTDFGDFENGVDDDVIGLSTTNNLQIVYSSQLDDEQEKVISMVRIVAEAVPE